ncbi:MAG: hypothetical protein ACN6OU_02180 [Stenotrophomonas acidaminiphila]|uniref:hypothetical protein n=1 Tax=Stenotrophomonas acidaminiphila TaxID=128780 RepID=UPI0028A6F498|nr:hypothetical protein [Stenotrophomonas acidaminiphila]
MLEEVKEFKKEVYGAAPPPNGGSTWAVLLVVGSLICGLIGLFGLTQATMGVGFVGLGLMAGVLARIAQARAQHKAVMAALRSR